MFPNIDKNEGFPERELAVGKFWKERDIYHKSLAARAGAPPFVFYEGPPTANGMPHPGHCLTRAIKDLFPRYKTMRGYRCERKAGWDTHGLPVEVEVCKELGIHAKEEIEAYGVEPFIQKCQQSVWRYMQQWRRLTERLGFWVDLDDAYVTYHQSYIESVWWSLKNLFDRGLLYRGHKIVWWWAQGGTALSAGEVGQGYRQVADPSVYVKFPIIYDETAFVLDLPEKTSLLVWTTTPWTLFSNMFVAISFDVTYALVREGESKEHIIVANELVESLQKKFKSEWTVIRTFSGKDLRMANYEAGGLRYRPPFPEVFYNRPVSSFSEFQEAVNTTDDVKEHYVKVDKTTPLGAFKAPYQLPISKGSLAWHLVGAPFVTTDAGTGLVHIAPAFGEGDFDVWLFEVWDKFAEPFNEIFLNPVESNGKFNEDVPQQYIGRWVKECDKDIIRDLKARGLLLHQEQYLHDYPFCWRAEEDPLIQYPRRSWFIRTTEYKDQMLANNAKINWLPEHIRDGRFGKFLESNVDWALSRERYWGTPLPIWVCSETGKMEAVGSYEELLAKPQAAGFEVWEAAKEKNLELPDDLRIHKPYIDAVTYDSPFAKGARMTRVPEVIDCWYDSGAMPFAQWGYQGEPQAPGEPDASASGIAKKFHSQFPADFISEAIDQTRGWFYSQLAISTMLFGPTPPAEAGPPGAPYPHPFKNCIVLGLMLGEDGQKMSKSKRNYREPNEIFDRYGADALRWYFFANQPPWTSIRYSEEAIRDSIPEFLLRLWNVYSFFTIYANIDGFHPSNELTKPLRTGHFSDQFASAQSYRPIKDRGELDRWVLGELHATCAKVVERMDQYDNYGGCQAITAFVDGLSNWYVRRSRDRYWAKETRSTDKLDAYWTLYECLITTSKLIAPFVPFLAERLWQDLAVAVFNDAVPESVHLCDYPLGNAAIDEALSEQMDLVRLVSSLGRQARSAAELKVRQPLAKVEVILADVTHLAWLEEHAGVIAEELNVKAVEFSDTPEKYVDHEVLPNFKLLGPKLGKLMPRLKGILAQQSGSELLANIRDNGKIDLVIDGQEVALTPEEVEVRIKAKPGWTSANDKGVVVVLATEITAELLAEGLARDLVRVIQDIRKDKNCDYTDRIRLGIESDAKEIQSAVSHFKQFIMNETLADKLELGRLDGPSSTIEARVSEYDVTIHFTTKLHLRT